MASANSMIRIASLGKSPRGSFVVIEEYGYLDNSLKLPFSKIKVMNTTKYKILDEFILSPQVDKIETNVSLSQLRKMALGKAKQEFKQYNIQY